MCKVAVSHQNFDDQSFQVFHTRTKHFHIQDKWMRLYSIQIEQNYIWRENETIQYINIHFQHRMIFQQRHTATNRNLYLLNRELLKVWISQMIEQKWLCDEVGVNDIYMNTRFQQHEIFQQQHTQTKEVLHRIMKFVLIRYTTIESCCFLLQDEIKIFRNTIFQQHEIFQQFQQFNKQNLCLQYQIIFLFTKLFSTQNERRCLYLIEIQEIYIFSLYQLHEIWILRHKLEHTQFQHQTTRIFVQWRLTINEKQCLFDDMHNQPFINIMLHKKNKAPKWCFFLFSELWFCLIEICCNRFKISWIALNNNIGDISFQTFIYIASTLSRIS